MDREQLLAKLNKEQQRAVSAPRGNILVLAGAGSGKTRILVHRIAWLLSQESVDTRNILAVTFTNKAANEMRKRISSLLRAPLADMWVGTFHGLANRMLRIFHEAAGLAQDFQILDSDDQKRLIKRMLKEANVSEKTVRPASLQGFINRNKDAGIRAAAAQQRADTFYNQRLAGLYQEYEVACERAQVVDFAELLLRAYELLDEPEVLARLQGRFTEILVDEFQDTNTIQYAWLRKICGAHNHIMAVGDDDQSIYGWRGAQIANIQAFSREMPDAVTIRSEQNYRSTDTILQAANSLIKNNNNRLGKNLWTEYGLGEAITHYHAFNAQDEARYLVQALLSSCERNDWRLDDCAILYRSNAQSRILEEELRHHNVPYRIYGGQRFFERLEIKNTLAYARLMVNNQDDSAFERVVTHTAARPWRPELDGDSRSSAHPGDFALGRRRAHLPRWHWAHGAEPESLLASDSRAARALPIADAIGEHERHLRAQRAASDVRQAKRRSPRSSGGKPGRIGERRQPIPDPRRQRWHGRISAARRPR